MTTEETPRAYTLPNDDAPDVSFTGVLIGEADSHSHEGPQNTRWTSIAIYKTDGGKLVGEVIGHTRWQGERTRHAVHVAKNEAGLVAALGYGWLAKAALADAGIEHTVDVEEIEAGVYAVRLHPSTLIPLGMIEASKGVLPQDLDIEAAVNSAVWRMAGMIECGYVLPEPNGPEHVRLMRQTLAGIAGDSDGEQFMRTHLRKRIADAEGGLSKPN